MGIYDWSEEEKEMFKVFDRAERQVTHLDKYKQMKKAETSKEIINPYTKDFQKWLEEILVERPHVLSIVRLMEE